MIYTSLVRADVTLEHINDTEWRIIDCRFDLKDKNAGLQHYREAHIPSAIYADLDKDLSSPVRPGTGRHPLPAIDDISRKLGEWGISATTQVVVYDDVSGSYAARLWWLLKWLGHQKVAILDGGLSYWKQQGYPLNNEIPDVIPASFQARPDMSMIIDTEALLKLLNSPSLTLVDVRDPARYTGAEEPIDKVAGHIPGSVNIPWKSNLDENGLYRNKTDLESLYSHFLINQETQNTVFMCGSGVTACHSLVALHYLGKSDVKLYPGSWSEWIEDPARPVEKSD